jgi:tryptophan halogenase
MARRSTRGSRRVSRATGAAARATPSTVAPPGSLGEVLAAEGRFQPPAVEPGSPLAELDYALRWNPAAYRNLLVGEAQRLGVQYREGAVTAIALRLGGGIDAIGRRRRRARGSRPTSTSTAPGRRRRCCRSCPRRAGAPGSRSCRSAGAVRPPGSAVLGSRTHRADPVGWRSDLAGRDAAQSVLAMVEGTTEAAARAALGTDFADFVALDPGRTEQAWIGNVVASAMPRRPSSRSPGSTSTSPTASSRCCSSCSPAATPTSARAPSSTAAPA